KPLPKPATMVAVRMSVTSGMLRSSAIWQSGSTLISPQEKASRRSFETRSSRKSGTRLTASIKESRPPASRRRDHLARPDRVRKLQQIKDALGTKKKAPGVPGRSRRRRMTMRKTSLILFGAAAGVAVTLIATQPRIVLDGARAQTADADTYRQLSLFGDIFERLRADYVEKPDDSKLIESAISGMLAGLDPHSSYMDSNSFRDIQVQPRGAVGGTGVGWGGRGIEVTMEDGLIKVVAPIDETPAAKAGIMANDIITHLDDEPVHGLTLNQAVEKMRGPENSKIKLKIMRKGQEKPIE